MNNELVKLNNVHNNHVTMINISQDSAVHA